MAAPPPEGDGADRWISQYGNGSPDNNPIPPAPQALRCAACRAEGRPPTIDQSDPRPVLTFVWNWQGTGRYALLCAACRAKLAKPRRRRARR
jgi:hypothetical protein